MRGLHLGQSYPHVWGGYIWVNLNSHVLRVYISVNLNPQIWGGYIWVNLNLHVWGGYIWVNLNPQLFWPHSTPQKVGWECFPQGARCKLNPSILTPILGTSYLSVAGLQLQKIFMSPALPKVVQHLVWMLHPVSQFWAVGWNHLILIN